MPGWKHADVFPIIANTIESLATSKQDFVTHDEIVQGLLEDPMTASIVEEAHRTQPQHSHEWLAHNMVAWFSQRISMDESDWADRFERHQFDGKWAYRMRTESTET